MGNHDQNTAFPSQRATRIALVIAVPLALVVGAQAVSWAVPKVWQSGEPLTAADLNGNFSSLDDAVAALGGPNPWVQCGTFEDLRDGAAACVLASHPPEQYEYAFKYNGPEPQVANCTGWNRGLRVANRDPYFVNADNPTNGLMALGGAVFYTETDATDDDIPAQCGANTWRHAYWRITDGNVGLFGSNGCMNPPLFCRRR
jgi:hypothetical protein